jgi:hypothetical protein
LQTLTETENKPGGHLTYRKAKIKKSANLEIKGSSQVAKVPFQSLLTRRKGKNVSLQLRELEVTTLIKCSGCSGSCQQF